MSFLLFLSVFVISIIIYSGYVVNNKIQINEKEGNYIWKEMLKKRRKLPTSSFTKYMQTLAKKV